MPKHHKIIEEQGGVQRQGVWGWAFLSSMFPTLTAIPWLRLLFKEQK